jgi:RNA polymerase sigma-70 factor (ECF subfamily)
LEREKELEAIRAVLAGDPEPFAQIVTAYQNLVASVAWKMNTPREEVDDVVSEVFLKAYRKLHLYDPSYALSTWLYRIATNHVLDQRKSARRRLEVEMGEGREPAVEATAGDDVLAGERERLLRAAMEELPGKYREVLTLFHMEGLSVEETASALGVPAGTVKVRLMRGRNRLGEILAGRHPEHFGGGAS